MNFPQPGKPVRGSKTGVPIMALFDLLGRSWSMGVIWHLHARPCTFRDLQASCESVSPTVLNKRLKELAAANLLERTTEGYALTKKGEELYHLINPLGKWAKIWARSLR